MKISIHQPAYLPWLGYLDRIRLSDVFVYLDSVQYQKGSYQNRNKIKNINGEMWLTVPIKKTGHLGMKLNEIEIDYQSEWKKKHLTSIKLNYSKAPFFRENYHKLLDLYENNHQYLSDLCFEHLKFWNQKYKISTKIIKSSELSVNGNKSDLVLNICKELKASEYISGIYGKDYLDENVFHKNNINIKYHSYKEKEYPQLWGNWIANLSIVDFWMNCGQSLKF